MNRISGIVLASLVCILGLGGCKKHEAVLPPDAKVNPNPTKKYRLLLTVPDPPGELSVTGELTYAIENSRDCVPLDHTLAIGGVHSSFPRTMQAQVVPLDGENYELIFYDDAFISEDYYGRGVCLWEGVPVLEIAWSGNRVIAAPRNLPNTQHRIEVRMCPFKSGASPDTCVEEEYARHDLQQYFPISITIARIK